MDRIIKTLFIAVLFCCSSAYAEDGSQDDLTVKLKTDSQLVPAYVDDIPSANAEFEKLYLNRLQKVLSFDLNVNGRTQVVPHTAEREALAIREAGKDSIYASSWKALNTAFVIKPEVNGKTFSVRVFTVDPTKMSQFGGYALTGDLDSDRRVIHRVADQILKGLFNQEGVATTKILYTVKVKNNDPLSKFKAVAEVWEADYDGANPKQVTHEGKLCVTPSYMPPKKGSAPSHFFYVCYRTAQPKIYYAALKDGIGEAFSTLRGNQLMPMASPKRDAVAYVSDAAGNPDLFLQPFNPETKKEGTPRQIFASVKGVQGSPTFSPNGKQIAFVSNKDGVPRIYILDIPAVGTPLKEMKVRLISRRNKENTSPAWSPDGSMIAYSSMTFGTRQIWIYTIATGEETQLTDGVGNKENPAWAPDSLHLVYNAEVPSVQDSAELYLIDLNGQQPRKISSGAGEKRFPSWSASN